MAENYNQNGGSKKKRTNAIGNPSTSSDCKLDALIKSEQDTDEDLSSHIWSSHTHSEQEYSCNQTIYMMTTKATLPNVFARLNTEQLTDLRQNVSQALVQRHEERLKSATKRQAYYFTKVKESETKIREEKKILQELRRCTGLAGSGCRTRSGRETRPTPKFALEDN